MLILLGELMTKFPKIEQLVSNFYYYGLSSSLFLLISFSLTFAIIEKQTMLLGITIVYLILGFLYSWWRVYVFNLKIIGKNIKETIKYVFLFTLNAINWIFLINQE